MDEWCRREFAVEVLMHFEECDRNAARPEQRQHRQRDRTDDTAGSFLDVSSPRLQIERKSGGAAMDRFTSVPKSCM